MALFEEDIQNWIIHETTGLIDGRLKNFPDMSTIRELTEGKNKEIWKFISKRVKSQQSIAFARKILQLRQHQKNQRVQEKYHVRDEKDCVILKQEVINAEEKVVFLENSNKNIIDHITSLKTSVKNKKEENCILNQKCSFLELAAVNCNEKNNQINNLICKLNIVLAKLFACEKTKCFENWKVQKSLEVNKEKVQMIDIKCILKEIMQIVDTKMLNESKKMPVLVHSVSEIMDSTQFDYLVNVLRDMSKQSYESLENKCLENNSMVSVQQSNLEISKDYLLCLKQEHVDSCFSKKRAMKHQTFNVKLDNLCLNKNFESSLHKDYLLLYVQNESLLHSIQYLEEQFLKEQSRATIVKKSYENQELLCQDLESSTQEFHDRLVTLHKLFNATPQIFSDISSILMSVKTFIDSSLLCEIRSKPKGLINEVNKINDYKLSIELLNNKAFLKDFIQEFDLTNLNLPNKFKEFPSVLKPFKNKSLLINQLVSLKKELSLGTNNFNFEFDESFSSELQQLIASFEDRLDCLIKVEKDLYGMNDNFNLLKTLLIDWWSQGAQFIPNIICENKSLKMWLDILNVLDNTN